ncbi:hypothetical protein K340107D12_53850 [Blautia parvula]|uniref:Uncharacterized protein n=1 Tax=Blautia parvula TaxID=2877527 RepID=A0ABQ0C199_9FIRM
MFEHRTSTLDSLNIGVFTDSIPGYFLKNSAEIALINEELFGKLAQTNSFIVMCINIVGDTFD